MASNLQPISRRDVIPAGGVVEAHLTTLRQRDAGELTNRLTTQRHAGEASPAQVHRVVASCVQVRAHAQRQTQQDTHA